MSTPPFVARRRQALQAAADLLDDLDVDQEQPIDVFEAVARMGLWLVFQPLTTLLGAVIREGDGGIMITTERPPTIQRYTAAHEVGHWELDHNRPAFDTDHDVLHPGANEREQLAQWFASYFLMPPPLVHAVASRHGVRPHTAVLPTQAYLIARDMRVSYEAALRQMTNLNIIGDNQRDELMQVPQLRIKQDLAYGHRPQVGNADIWPVDERSMRYNIDVVLHDEIIINLPENRTSGHRWLDDTATDQRINLERKPAPPAFAPPTATRPPPVPLPDPPRRTGADITAALALLPGPVQTSAAVDRTADEGVLADHQHTTDDFQATEFGNGGLVAVSDDYQPGWAPVTARGAASLRRRNAGAPVEPSTFLATTANTEAVLADPSAPGAGATGRRWLVLQAHSEGEFTYTLHYAATHDPHASPAATFTVEATVQPPLEVLHRRTLTDIDLDDTAATIPDGDSGHASPRSAPFDEPGFSRSSEHTDVDEPGLAPDAGDENDR